MRILIPIRDLKRYKRNTEIYEEYQQMSVEDHKVSANQLFTILAAKHNISVVMVRRVLEQYTQDYPLSVDNKDNYLHSR